MKKLFACILAFCLVALPLHARAVLAETTAAETTAAETTAAETTTATLSETTAAPDGGSSWSNYRGSGSIASPADYWNANGWPDDVSYACDIGGEVTADGNADHWWQIGLIGGTEARRAELSAMFTSDNVIDFEDNARWNHATRQAAADAIAAAYGDNVQVSLIQNTDNVWVIVPDEQYDAVSQAMSDQYGIMVLVESDSAVAAMDVDGLAEETMTGAADVDGMSVETTAGGAAAAETATDTLVDSGALVSRDTQTGWILAAVLLCVALGTAGAVVLRRRRTAVLDTGHGEQTSNAPLSKKAVEAAVKASEEAPDTAIDAKIRENLHR